MNWILKPFQKLTVEELYKILQLRNEVFVVEQNCVYQDADGKDPDAHHLLGMQGVKLVAYSRILPPDEEHPHPAIGRVVTAPGSRRTGLGKMLMKEAISATESLFGKTIIKVSAQLYLKKFYESLDFQQVSEVYLEDGIEHISMHRILS